MRDDAISILLLRLLFIQNSIKNVDVFHLCFDPVFESYSEKVWPQLNVKKINDNIFAYNLKKKNTFINFGEGDSSFSKYYDI